MALKRPRPWELVEQDITRIDHTGLVQRGNSLQVKFVVTNYNTPCAVNKHSSQFVINGAVVFQARVVLSQIDNKHTNTYHNLVFVRFLTQRREEHDISYKIRLNCPDLCIMDKCFTSDDGTWHLIHENKKQRYTFFVSITMDVVSNVNSFAALLYDDELTDFELRGEDGAIRMHKAVLAAASPVFKRMLCGTWKDAAEGHVEVPGTSKHSLQNLKNYVYLHTLPTTGLKQLLLLAFYYVMPVLALKCMDRLIEGLNAQNAYDLLEFALKYKATRVVLAILDTVQKGEVQVDDIRKREITCFLVTQIKKEKY